MNPKQLLEFCKFSLGVQQASFELEQLRTDLDAWCALSESNFSPSIKQRTHPLRTVVGLTAFTLATLFLDGLPARLILSAIFVLAIYETVAMANGMRSEEYGSLFSGASVSFCCLLAIISIWALASRDLVVLVLLVATAHVFGNAIDWRYPSQPLPRPWPNLYLQKTWFGILGTTILPAFVTASAIRLQLLERGCWSFAGVGLATVLADWAIAQIKRRYGFHYSGEAAESSHGAGGYCVRFLRSLFGDERGLLDRFAPLIFASVLLLFGLKLY